MSPANGVAAYAIAKRPLLGLARRENVSELLRGGKAPRVAGSTPYAAQKAESFSRCGLLLNTGFTNSVGGSSAREACESSRPHSNVWWLMLQNVSSGLLWAPRIGPLLGDDRRFPAK
eukprot:scaffold18122_cov68-Phaeocystis_antarctica.AAC.3